MKGSHQKIQWRMTKIQGHIWFAISKWKLFKQLEETVRSVDTGGSYYSNEQILNIDYNLGHQTDFW